MLKPGTIEILYNNNKNASLYNAPVVQLLSLKRMESKNDKNVRYHITISDGKFYMKGIFSSQVSKDVKNLNINTLIKINDFVILEKNGNSFIFVKDCSKIKDIERIGSPKSISKADVNSSVEMHSSKIKNADHDKIVENSKRKTDKNVKNCNYEDSYKRKHIDEDNLDLNQSNVKQEEDVSKKYTPIAALNPFQTKWIIKGTVQKKSDIREFKKKDGKFFTFELFDKTGSIKCVAFNDAVDIFFNLFSEGSVIELSKCSVKMANKKFTNTTSDYEIHLEKNSTINLLNEEALVVKYNFSKIKDIVNGQQKISFDLIAVVHEAFPAGVVVSKSTQKEIKKRDLILVDETGNIRMTLWGDKSEIEVNDHPTILFSGARISEYNSSVVLGCSFVCTVKIDPEIKESFSLRGWYDDNKESVKVEKPTRVDYSFFEEVDGYATCIATLLFIREDNLFYNAFADNCIKR